VIRHHLAIKRFDLAQERRLEPLWPDAVALGDARPLSLIQLRPDVPNETSPERGSSTKRTLREEGRGSDDDTSSLCRRRLRIDRAGRTLSGPRQARLRVGWRQRSQRAAVSTAPVRTIYQRSWTPRVIVRSLIFALARPCYFILGIVASVGIATRPRTIFCCSTVNSFAASPTA